MASLDTVSITILLGALLVMAGIMSSLVALRFGAPLLLAFLGVGLLAGEGGPGGIKFDDVRAAFTVGSVALGLILFDGGLRTRYSTFRSVLGPAGMLATLGVLITAALTAPMAWLTLGLSPLESLLVGAVIASTDAAAVFFLLHAHGLRLRPRVNSTLEVESATNDPFAIFLTIVLVEVLLVGNKSWAGILVLLVREALFGTIIGLIGGRAMVLVEIKASPAVGGPLESRVAEVLDRYAGPAGVISFEARALAWFAANRMNTAVTPSRRGSTSIVSVPAHRLGTPMASDPSGVNSTLSPSSHSAAPSTT